MLCVILISSYDNYIRLFPTGEYTPNFLASAGGIYYNHKKFAEAKVYFQTLVRRFPGAKERSLAMRSIMDSYFALGKFKDSEIIAKRILSDENLPEEQLKRHLEEHIPLEYSHTLDDQIGGQITAGFTITGFFEDRFSKGENDPLSEFVPYFISTRALKPSQQ